MSELAIMLLSKCAEMDQQRTERDNLDQDIADFFSPRDAEIKSTQSVGLEGYVQHIYDTTALDALRTAAAGQFDFLYSGKWFDFDAPDELGEEPDEEAKNWYRQAAMTQLRDMATSNFPLAMHEALLNRTGFAHCNILTERPSDGLNYSSFDPGEYAIDENNRRKVDVVSRVMMLTARQAAQQFGDDALGPIVSSSLASKDASEKSRKFKFFHIVMPREDAMRLPGKIDNLNMPYASYYVCEEDKIIVEESGFNEMPYAVGRYLKWGRHMYGYSPAIETLPIVRQLNFIEKNQDALSELAAFPRVLVPDNMFDEVDLRAGGITSFDPNVPNGMPKEFATQGRYDIAKDRVRDKREAVQKAFHVDLFKALADKTKQMTATEVLELVQEKIINFSPTFARLVTELNQPVINRTFSLMFRAGRFGQPPKSVIIEKPDGSVGIPTPKIVYVSKMALAIRALENKQTLEFLALTAELAGVKPELMDHINFDKLYRKMADNHGINSSFMNNSRTVDSIREQRAQMEQAQAAIDGIKGVSQGAANLGRAPQEIQNQVIQAVA